MTYASYKTALKEHPDPLHVTLSFLKIQVSAPVVELRHIHGLDMEIWPFDFGLEGPPFVRLLCSASMYKRTGLQNQLAHLRL